MGNQTSIPSFYADSPLSSRQIRLLSIFPSSDPKQQLECSIIRYDLDNAPSYEALSYVWGSIGAFSNVSVIVNGEAVKVGSNLASALTRLRRADAPRVIWTDALCIDQSDNNEKSHQITLMGSIYSLAQRTVVWLGDGYVRQVRDAVGCVRIIAAACREYAETYTLGTNPTNRYKPVNVPVNALTAEVCESLRVLYDLPWFSRIWCVQEIYLAQDGLMLWGSEEVPWADVRLAALWIYNRSVYPDPDDAATSQLDASGITIPAEWLTDASDKRLPLLELLQDYRERECTDPKDKVYGLLSLAAPEEAKAIDVDYNKSVGEVYADTVLTTIRQSKRLTALAFVSHIDRYADNGIPSWAPRWNDHRVAMPIGAPDEASVPFSACARQPIRSSDIQTITPQRLTLTGIIYDTICSVQQLILPIPFDFPHLDNPQIVDKSLINHVRPLGLPERHYLDNHPFLRAPNLARAFDQSPERWHRLARTLNAGEVSAGVYAQNLDEAGQATFTGSVLHLMAKLSGESDPEWGDYAQYEPASLNFRNGAFVTSTLRRLFLTEGGGGGYGLGPQCALPGDVVVVLYGGNTPYVLRPRRNGEYVFIGQAYVDQIMNGEAVRDVEAGKRVEERFCII
jgi:hypothetical protein